MNSAHSLSLSALFLVALGCACSATTDVGPGQPSSGGGVPQGTEGKPIPAGLVHTFAPIAPSVRQRQTEFLAEAERLREDFPQDEDGSARYEAARAKLKEQRLAQPQ